MAVKGCGCLLGKGQRKARLGWIDRWAALPCTDLHGCGQQPTAPAVRSCLPHAGEPFCSNCVLNHRNPRRGCRNFTWPQVKEGQPGLQRGMEAQPVTTGLPTQHGHQDVSASIHMRLWGAWVRALLDSCRQRFCCLALESTIAQCCL